MPFQAIASAPRSDASPAGSTQAGSAALKVLYVLGFDRSGTTLLGNLLDQIGGFTHVGELFYLLERSLRASKNLCGCGQPLTDCAFWVPVLRAALNDIWSTTPRADSLTPETEAPSYSSHLEQALATQRSAIRTSRVVGTFLSRLVRSQGRNTPYAELTQALYRRAAHAAGARVLIDTSKLTKPAVYLGCMKRIDPYFVHIVRDPRGTTLSRQRKRASMIGGRVRLNAPTTIADALRWIRRNAAAEVLCRALAPDRYMSLAYEQFAASPASTLRAIMEFVGEKQADFPFFDGSSVVLQANHTVCGNRIRFQRGRITLSADEAWHELLRSRDKLAISALTLPGLLHYGYPLNGRAASVETLQ